MSKAFNSISAFILILVNGIKRFYTNTCFTVIIFGISAYLINWDGISSDVSKMLGRIILVSILGFLISTLFTLIAEKLNHNTKLLKIINVITSFIVPILYFFFILTDIENKYQSTSLAGIFIALILIAIYFANKTNNENFSNHFSYIIKNLFVAAIVTLIVMLGLFLCTAAVYFLIYKFSEVYKIYATIASFCWIVLFVNLYLAMLPKNQEDYKTPKFFKVITLYTALPIYIGLIIILYIYLGKILVTHNFPSGQLNWFASFASLIGIFLFLTLKQYYNNNAFVKWYVKLFGYILLPIIAMQCIAYNIRVLSYGFTSLRYISIVLIGISIVTAIVSLIKSGKYVPYILFLLALCSIITTTGLLNLYDVPVYEQESRLVRALKDNSMLDNNNKIAAKSDIDQQTKIKITSAYDYIVTNNVEKSKLLKDYTSEAKSFKQIFGFDREVEIRSDPYSNQNDQNTYVNYNSELQEININGYNTLLNVSNYNLKQNFIKEINNNVLTIKFNEKVFTFDLNTFIKDLYKEYGITNAIAISQDKLMIEQGKLLITNISFNVNKGNDVIIINNIDGYILGK